MRSKLWSIRFPKHLKFEPGSFSADDRRRIRNYWMVMALFGLILIGLEVIDHSSMHLAHGTGSSLIEDSEFIREAIMYGVALPIFGGALLTLLNQAGAQRDRLIDELDRMRALAEELQLTADWYELSARIVRLPGTVMPTVRTFLTVFDRDDQHSDLAASWATDGTHVAGSYSEPRYAFCQGCLRTRVDAAEPVSLCSSPDAAVSKERVKRYCLPLMSGDELVAVLNFDLPPNRPPTARQRRILSGVEPEITMAIENARLQQSIAELAETATTERQRVAQDLHDTLAQNITFLRLKLGQLSAEEYPQDPAIAREEIGRMYRVADEAYSQVRETLVELRNDSQGDITDVLNGLANSIQERSQLRVQVTSRGRPFSLPPYVRRQAVYVCREALNNVQKHAVARTVQVELLWGQSDLSIIVRDDGRGFTLADVQDERCYGLRIMDERARAIGGQLSLESAPNQGTIVSLSIAKAEDKRSGASSASLPVEE